METRSKPRKVEAAPVTPGHARDDNDDCVSSTARLAVDMDIHGYIHVWISDLSHPLDISMDITFADLLIKLNTYMLCLSIICLSVVSTLHFLVNLCY